MIESCRRENESVALVHGMVKRGNRLPGKGFVNGHPANKNDQPVTGLWKQVNGKPDLVLVGKHYVTLAYIQINCSAYTVPASGLKGTNMEYKFNAFAAS